MNTPYKFVSPLDETQIAFLNDTIRNDHSARARIRAQSILLSSKGYGIDELANIFDVYRNTVSSWIDHWEEHGIDSLNDQSRCGAPSKLTDSDIDVVKHIVTDHPHAPNMILARITEQLKKTISLSTLKRIIKRNGLRWKRVRTSVKKKRDEGRFEQAAQDINAFEHEQRIGRIALYYFDESGFSLHPPIAYAYQPIGQTITLNSSSSQRLNILGFFTTKNQLTSFAFTGHIDAEIVIRCFDEFSHRLVKKTVVILDNSSLHHSKKFQAHVEQWKARGLFLYYLPTYSPELNRIEILWRFIKYHWLPFSAYLSFHNLVDEVKNILSNVGKKYRINFV